MGILEFTKLLRNKGYTTIEIMRINMASFECAKDAHEGMNLDNDYLEDIGRSFIIEQLDNDYDLFTDITGIIPIEMR